MGYHDRYEANVNAETIGSDEIWEAIFKGDDKVSLKGAHGRYLRAYGNGQVKADAQNPNPWETYTKITSFLKSNFLQYLP